MPTRLLAISGRVRRFSDAGGQVRGGEDPAGWLFLGPLEATKTRQPKLGPVEAPPGSPAATAGTSGRCKPTRARRNEMPEARAGAEGYRARH